jgi:predicted transcriptional regulator of viral defense system
MENERTPTRRVMEMAHQLRLLQVRDVVSRGIHPEYVRRLCQRGRLMRIGRGLYAPADADLSPHLALAAAAKCVPRAIACLLTALHFHEIGTQLPSEVWLALDRATAKPRIAYPVLRIVRFSGDALSAGIETHRIENVSVRVYGPAKTVADCFKYRHKIGLDIGLEALRECVRERRCTFDELWHYARICRVANVMRPYLEAFA